MASPEWPAAARELAMRSPVARLATCGDDGMPHAVPICFVLESDSLYSIVDAKPKRAPTRMKRLRNVDENPRAAVIIDVYDEDWSRLEYVMLRGAAARVHDVEEFDRIVTLLREKYEPYRSMRFEPDENPLLRLDVEKVVYWRMSRAASGRPPA